MLTFSWIPKSKMMSHNCLWTCVASSHSKRYNWMLNGTFLVGRRPLRQLIFLITFYKRENNSPVLTFSRIPKSKMMTHSWLWTCIAIIAFKTVRLDVKCTFSSWKETVKINWFFFIPSKAVSMTTQLSNFKQLCTSAIVWWFKKKSL